MPRLPLQAVETQKRKQLGWWGVGWNSAILGKIALKEYRD